jgi:hypothetical protein
MAKKVAKNRTMLNSDTGAILFLLGVSLIFVAVANITIKGFYHNITTNACLGILAILMLIVGCLITLKNRDEYKYESAPETKGELRSSLESAMELAWRDHHHARDQTWKGLQMEALLAIALIGIDLKAAESSFKYVPLVGSLLLFLIAISGIMIALHHRELERGKFRHIMHCEDALGIRPYIDGVKLPAPLYIWDLFAFWKSNTVLFIMRMHFAILIFALWFFMTRLQP